MNFDPNKVQVVLSYLPGYMWSNGQLHSTGTAIPPTQHINPKNGEPTWYCRPIFTYGATVGLYIKHQGIVDAIARGDV